MAAAKVTTRAGAVLNRTASADETHVPGEAEALAALGRLDDALKTATTAHDILKAFAAELTELFRQRIGELAETSRRTMEELQGRATAAEARADKAERERDSYRASLKKLSGSLDDALTVKP